MTQKTLTSHQKNSSVISNSANYRNTNPENFDFQQIKDFLAQSPPFDYTELGNAKRLPELLKGHFHYIEAYERFVIYKNGRWSLDEDFLAIRVIDLLLANLTDEIEFYVKLLKRLNSFSEEYKTDPIKKILMSRIKEIKTHHKATQRKQAIQATLDLFKAQKGITQRIDSFDSKGHFIGCKNGIIDLRDGSLVQDDPSFKMMKSTNVEYHASAECPLFKKFLSEIFEDREDVVSFMQLLAGQLMSGVPNKNKFIIFLGDGANGKSVFLDVLVSILGDYAEQTASDVFTEKRKDKAYYQAELVGKRLVTMNETERGDKLDGAMVKSAVDSGRLSARSPFARPFSFQPYFTPIMCTNYMPYVSQDPAIWRRLIIVPFYKTVPESKRDPNLRQKLIKEEASGIFNWMVEGAKKYFELGQLEVPTSLEKIQVKYRREFDNIGHFISECRSDDTLSLEFDELKCRITELRKGYAAWCKENGYIPLSTRQFRQELVKKGIEIYKGSGGHEYVRGIQIQDFDTKCSEIMRLQVSDELDFE